MSYIVVSPPPYIDCEELHRYLISNISLLKSSRCILEFGKEGTHPHLNYVCNGDVSYVEVLEAIEAYFKTLYYPCGKRRRMGARVRAHILDKKRIYDKGHLDVYLNKEADAKLLLDNPYPEIDWEFTYLEYKHFPTEITKNIISWLSNYSIVKQLRIVDDWHKFDNEVRKMLIGDFNKLLRFNSMHTNTIQGIRNTVQTHIKK